MSGLRTFIDGILAINNVNNIMNCVAAVLTAFILGLLIFTTYKITCKAFNFDSEYGLVLIVVPVVVALLLSVIGSNIARAFSLAGALSIIRYRSTIIKPKNIAFIFFGMGAGFITGVGLYIPALLFVLLTSVIIIVYTACTINKSNEIRTLTVDVPESINYDGLLDDTMKKYTNAYALTGVRITSGGTVTQLEYTIQIKSLTETKAFLDELRVKNGNFKIHLTQFVSKE